VSFVAHDIAKKLDLKTDNRLAFIDTAAEVEEGDKQWLSDDRQALVDAGFEVTDYTITNKTPDELLEDLHDFKYIYLSGGNTYHLLQQSKKSGFDRLVHEMLDAGKIYISTSAGSIIAGPKLPEYLMELDDPLETGMENKNAYGLVDFVILPHWGSDNFRDRYLNTRLNIAYDHPDQPYLLLADNQYIHVVDDRYHFVEVHK
jgi:dipeptidase E